MLLTAVALPPGWYLFGGTPAIAERQFDALREDVSTIRANIAARSRPAAPGAESCG